MAAILRALCFGALCAIAVSVSAALRAPVSTPEGRAEVDAWFTRVPPGWPAKPWAEARFERSWGRETWELRGDPPLDGGRRGDGFTAEWVQRTGWPLPAFQCVRLRLRTLWQQGEPRLAPWDGPSESLSEGLRIPASALGAHEGQMLIGVTPLWPGLAIDSIAWALPIWLIGYASRRLSERRAAKRRAAPPPSDRSTR